MAAFVLGNGISREQVSINRLLSIGPVYACNGIYRTHTVTALIATDQPISQEIQQSGYSQKNRFYTRRPLPDSGAQRVPQKYFGYSSGPIAAAIAAGDFNNPVYLIGFDMGPAADGKFNNVYAGTQFYKPVGAPPTFTGNWAKQLVQIMKDYASYSFIRVQGDTTARVDMLDLVPNLQHLPMSAFLDRINTLKDL